MDKLQQINRELAQADSRQRELELHRKVEQLERLELLGRLAGGVAHDFNNLLTVIIGYADLIEAGLGAGHPLNRAVTELRNAGERGAALTRQLLSLGRKRAIKPERFDLASHVRAMEVFLGRLLPANVQLTVHAPGPAWCHGDAGQMEQVIVNLAINARDALPGGGWVRIDVVSAANGTTLSVHDSGCGMDEAALAHAFDPFFTTKAEGRGTGLGLPTVQSIVREHGGDVTIASRRGEGTRVTIHLPVVAADPVASAPAAGSAPAVVLVVDDDRTVRRTVEVTLSRHGFHVLPAADAQEALAVSAAHPGPIDVLITDVVLPGLNGCDLAARLQGDRPALAAIYMSAHASGEVFHQSAGAPAGTFLAKPFTAQAVVETVRAAIAA